MRLINEHFEPVFNTTAATQIVFQRPVNAECLNLSFVDLHQTILQQIILRLNKKYISLIDNNIQGFKS
jgi:hypothetical protein